MMRRLLLTVAAVVAAVGSGACRKARPKQDDHRALESLGYVASSPITDAEAEVEGVTLLEPEASPGLTIVCQLADDLCELVDLSGKVVHAVRPAQPAQPPQPPLKGHIDPLGAYLLAPYDATDLIVLLGSRTTGTLSRMDWGGKVAWTAEAPDLLFHHDFALERGGDILALYGEERWIDHDGAKLPIYDDGLARIHPDGTFAKLVSFYDVLRDRISPTALDSLAKVYAAGTLTKGPGPASAKFVGMNETDVFHANGVMVAPADAARWKQGDYIVSFRNLGDTGGVFVLDRSTFAVKWSFHDGVENPHCPELAPDGHLLLFDNGPKRVWSRILEIDPATDKIVREYKSSNPLFFSRALSGVQALANGDWLITEGEAGHIFEVNRQDKIVWEYWNQSVAAHGGGGHMRGAIFRARRLAPGEPIRMAALRALLDDAAGHTVVPIHRTHRPPRVARAWPTGPGGSPSMTFMFDASEREIKFHAASTSLPPGDYRVVVGNETCSTAGQFADFGTFSAIGGARALSGKLQGTPPVGGLAALVGHHLVVLRQGTDELVACGPIMSGG